MLLQSPVCPLLHTNPGADPAPPPDDALDEVSGLVKGTDDPLDWTGALDAMLSDGSARLRQVERLSALQMLATVGGSIGARLLAAFWTQPDPGTLMPILAACPDLEPLAGLVQARGDGALDLPPLAVGTLRLVSIGDQLCQAGSRSTGIDLVTAATLVQAHHGNGQVALPVDRELAGVLATILAEPRPYRGGFAGSLEGVELVPGLLLIDVDDQPQFFPHGFPVLIDAGLAALGGVLPSTGPGDDAQGADPALQAVDRMRLRRLVLENIMATSVLLEYLRDPKVYGIPGLVAEVVNRTRNPQVLEVIITSRVLHTGFANKAVPLACLKSPVNVSIKSLRRFVHVKYVSRMDLKRLANDRTGIRREVGQEIVKYLESLT